MIILAATGDDQPLDSVRVYINSLGPGGVWTPIDTLLTGSSGSISLRRSPLNTSLRITAEKSRFRFHSVDLMGQDTIRLVGEPSVPSSPILVQTADPQGAARPAVSVMLRGRSGEGSWVTVDSTNTDANGQAFLLCPGDAFPAYRIEAASPGLTFERMDVRAGETVLLTAESRDLVERGERPKSRPPKAKTDRRPSRSKTPESGASDPGIPPQATGDCDRLPILERMDCYASSGDQRGVLGIDLGTMRGERRAEAHFRRAMAFSSLGEPDSASAEYGRAMGLSQRLRPQALLNLGIIHLRGARWEEAVGAFQEALNGELSHEKRGIAYYSLGRCFYANMGFTGQKEKYAALARQYLIQASDYLCTGRIQGRGKECGEIDVLLAKLEVSAAR